MGERITPTCDIFDTLQPKGLQQIRVVVEELTPLEGCTPSVSTVVIHQSVVAVGDRGRKRVIRIAKSATVPYGSKPKPEDAKDA